MPVVGMRPIGLYRYRNQRGCHRGNRRGADLRSSRNRLISQTALPETEVFGLQAVGPAVLGLLEAGSALCIKMLTPRGTDTGGMGVGFGGGFAFHGGPHRRLQWGPLNQEGESLQGGGFPGAHEICDTCVISCENMGGVEDCVTACRDCAESCRKMAGAKH